MLLVRKAALRQQNLYASLSRAKSRYVFHTRYHNLMTVDWDVGQMTIDTLADDVLLYVFDFYLTDASEVEAWHTLVHVCRQWRILVFRSPRRLNLRIACTNKTPVREKLDVWPALPIVVSGSCGSQTCLDNIIAGLDHDNRVCQIDLFLTRESEDIDIFEALEEPFPELTDLKLHLTEPPDPIFPCSDQYLGGTTHLRSLSLTGTPIPGLPNLLLSSTDLVDLRLMEIPISVFISPDEMVTALSALTRLQLLHLGPEFDLFHPDWENRRLPLPTTTVLPSLIELRFEGTIEYLEDLTARIDAPLLDRLDIVVSFHLTARRHGKYPMVGTSSALCISEEPLPFPRLCTTRHRARPGRTWWRNTDGGVTHPGERFHREVPVIWTCQSSHSELRFPATAVRSSHSYF